ncbi:MAG: hypothetical protein GY811_02285 [Myxococcales bacterium]|nr:hypothetical protein [Myxococcales bacterium]
MGGPDYCTTEGQTEVESVILGDSYEGFMPIGPESYSEVRYGNQGGAMLLFKVRALGPDVPACMTVDAVLEELDGTQIGSNQFSVSFAEDESGGSCSSQALPINLPYGTSFEGMGAVLIVRIGSVETSAEITMHEPG